MKAKQALLLVASLVFHISSFSVQPAFAVTVTGVTVMDANGAARTSFNNSESLNVETVVEGVGPGEKVDLVFQVVDPAGAVRATVTGNSGIGLGGRVVGGVHGVSLASAFTVPGTYKVVVRATGSGGAIGTGESAFVVLSPTIRLAYPLDGSRELADVPVTFRWTGSGSVRYRVTVADSAGLWRPIWQGQTLGAETELAYPLSPGAPEQRLVGGQVYYWSVEGLDGSGGATARTPSPWSFSVKGAATANTVRDVAVTEVRWEEAPQTDTDVEGTGTITITVKNGGSRPEASVPLTVHVNGQAVARLTLEQLAAGEKRTVQVGYTVGQGEGDKEETVPLLVAASVDVYDDRQDNNLLSQQFLVVKKPGGAQILGAVVDGESGASLAGADVAYEGPESGRVTTNEGGRYKIGKLGKLGPYKLRGWKPGYNDSGWVEIHVEKKKAYAQVDLTIQPLAQEVGAETALELVRRLPDLPREVMLSLEGYTCDGVELVGGGDVHVVLKELFQGKATVKRAAVMEGE